MLLCPLTSCHLKRAMVRGVYIWYSPESDGCLVNMGAARKLLPEGLSSEIWVRASLRNAISTWKKCPSCARVMKAVQSPVYAGAYEVDVCLSCQLFWLDKPDYPQVPLGKDLLTPEGDASLITETAADLAKIEIAREEKRNPGILGDGPEQWWKAIPAFVGLPVEMESNRTNEIPWMTFAIAALVLGVHIFAVYPHMETLREWGLIPTIPWRHYGLTILTWGFLHADWFHLLTNIYFFGVFGDDLEVYYGRRRFALLVVGTVLLSGMTKAIFSQSQIPTVGLSGAISAIIVNSGLIYRHSRIAFLLPYFHSLGRGAYARVFGWIRLSAIWVLLLFLAREILYYFVFEASHVTRVSHSGHLIGALYGFTFWLWQGRPRWDAPVVIDQEKKPARLSQK